MPEIRLSNILIVDMEQIFGQKKSLRDRKSNYCTYIFADKFLVTASVGISTIHPYVESTTSQQLIKESDIALYQAKREGRNCVRVGSNKD